MGYEGSIVEGIILKMIPYEEKKHIVTLFSEKGLLSFMLAAKSQQLYLSPLTLVECHLKKSRSDWYNLQDIHLLDRFLPIRQSLPHLQAAGLCMKAILDSQLPNKEAPKLYALLKSYLTHLMEFEDPQLLSSSFLIKTLRHEGLLNLLPSCCECGSKELSSLINGQIYCSSCKPLTTNELSISTLESILILGLSRDFASLKTLKDPLLHPHVLDLFQDTLKTSKS